MKTEIRNAKEDDIPAIMGLIRELAEYERLSEYVTASENDIKRHLFADATAEAIICEADGVPVGIAVFFYNLSTFAGRLGLYIEDIYVKEEFRGRGLGKMMMSRLAAIAEERGCIKMDWVVLNWNNPSIKFYESLGAEKNDTWTAYRMSGGRLEELAKKDIQYID
ncbi:MAG: GNAT family N-acetyltransferase [Candidatus Methanoplasma sp.]|jgi:ribosomal protein S18 acetylase RimI-like enzyme|nr:GNAT family N-acetyltransferase [Candidatus Methanoplasma sp.]